tara:strand:+ start:281 stop:1117 length:837 start_codon:yes stop_codon:yes gene_type:complete
MKDIEINQLIYPTTVTDGAGVKIKRSIGLQPSYYDPFLMFDEFGSENKDDYIAGFPPHPHRGIETVTYLLEGDFEHQDSLGSVGRMQAGDVQWMKTGSGIIHSEMPLMKDGKLHGFQLWINMPAKLKMTAPEYLHIDSDLIGRYSDKEKSIKVISGQFEMVRGAVKNHNAEPLYLDIFIKEGNYYNFDLCPKHNSFIYLYDGEVIIGKQKIHIVKDTTLVLLEKGDRLRVESKTNAKFLLISAKPINEQIARGGPFVMNTKEEIYLAIEEYQNGTFIK